MKFKRAYVEITNVCNLACPFCSSGGRAPRFMSVPEMERTLSELRPRTGHVYPHVLGEPLLHPAFADFAQICGGLGFNINLVTNGTLISGARGLDSAAVRHVTVSLHSAPHWPNGRADEYLAGIFDFVDRRKNGRPAVTLRLVRTGAGQSPAHDRVTAELMLRYGGAFERAEGARGVEVGDRLYLSRPALFQWPDINAEEISAEGFCLGLRDQIAVLADGTVSACCLDGGGNIALGNVFSRPLDDILGDAPARAVYDGFSARHAVHPLCRRCSYRSRFDK